MNLLFATALLAFTNQQHAHKPVQVELLEFNTIQTTFGQTHQLIAWQHDPEFGMVPMDYQYPASLSGEFDGEVFRDGKVWVVAKSSIRTFTKHDPESKARNSLNRRGYNYAPGGVWRPRFIRYGGGE